MKKAIPILMCLLFLLTILYPAGLIIAFSLGYSFELISIIAFSVIIALLSVSIAVIASIYKIFVDNIVTRIFLAVIIPLSLINAVFYISDSPRILTVASAFISVSCCWYLTARFAKPLALKIIALVLSGLMVFPIAFFCFIAVTFGSLGQNTVVETVESPSKEYYAQIVDSDQGALGGDTLVMVYEQSEINAIIFTIKKFPKTVYSGDWGEFENMEIYWKDDKCLVINSVKHKIE